MGSFAVSLTDYQKDSVITLNLLAQESATLKCVASVSDKPTMWNITLNVGTIYKQTFLWTQISQNTPLETAILFFFCDIKNCFIPSKCSTQFTILRSYSIPLHSWNNHKKPALTLVNYPSQVVWEYILNFRHYPTLSCSPVPIHSPFGHWQKQTETCALSTSHRITLRNAKACYYSWTSRFG